MPGRRFRRRKSYADGASGDGPDASSLDHTNSARAGVDSAVRCDFVQTPDNFVTQPPKPNKGLTGKISTLFRRESSGEHNTSNVPSAHPATSLMIRSSDSQTKKTVVPSRRSHSADGSAVSSTPRRSADVTETRGNSGKRIFYSSHQDDDSDDSYESRASRSVGGGRGRGASRRTSESDDNTRSVATGDFSSHTDGTVKLIKRFRGFSTSIKSLFLDESLVCGAFGCFGLILSNRTEYLLQLRNERRGAIYSRGNRDRNKRNMPSRIIAAGLLLTLLLMFSTFVIWGFGSGNGVVGDYLNGYDYYNESEEPVWDDYLTNDDGGENVYNNDDANQNDAINNDDGAAANQNDDAAAANGNGNNRRHRRALHKKQIVFEHRPLGVFKMRDYQEYLWNPIIAAVHDDWYSEFYPEPGVSLPNSRRRDEQAANDDAAVATTDDAAVASVDDAYYTDGSTANGGGSSHQQSNNYKGYQQRRDIASEIRIALLFAFLLFLGILGRRRRMRTRFYLVRARAQEDHLYYASSDQAAARRVAYDDTQEDQYEGACGHTLCGFYPVDEVKSAAEDENVQVSDMGIFTRKTKPHNEDIVARSFNCFLASCCGSTFKCWFQCLSICALAQEAREVRLLVPPRYQRIDYITHQPFREYQEAVNDLRRGWLGKARRISGIGPHFHALSRLSRYILILSVLAIFAIVATLLFNPRAAFSWQDAVVLVATFLQSFLVLFVVHWIFHKSDLCLDAVIKLFAAGFLIAVPTAFFFEGLLVNVVLFATWIFYDGLASVFGDSFSDWVIEHWRSIWILGELFNAYIVAAVTEELCKYYSFRAVEHPDLVFLTGLQRDSQEEAAVDGGLVTYPFASHQVQEIARSQSFAPDDVSVSERSHRSTRSHRSRSRGRGRTRKDTLIEQTGTTDAEFDEDDLDARTRRQKAMAITTGMISVAVGLACAENFLYVFVLGGAVGENDTQDANKSDFLEAWIVLFFRSIFPVHALAAAMQSINMIRKFVEFDDDGGHRVGVGRIVLPAILIHGSFDAVLMAVNVFVETSWDKYLAENDGKRGDTVPYNSVIVNLMAWISITGIMIAGLLWYYRENRLQRARLKVLEEQDKAMQTEQWVAGSVDEDDRIV